MNINIAEASMLHILKEQHENKMDVVLPASSLSMSNGSISISRSKLSLFSSLKDISLVPNDIFLNHLSDRLGIGRTYQKFLLENHPELYQYNVNTLLDSTKRNFLIRSVNGEARAFLSDSFKLMDNYDVLIATIDAVAKAREKCGVEIYPQSFCLTEKRMYCRFMIKQSQDSKLLSSYVNPETGDHFTKSFLNGFIVSNSDVGHGKLFIAPRISVAGTDIGYIWYDEKYQKTHLGAKMNIGPVASIKADRLEITKSFVDAICVYASQLPEKVAYLEQLNINMDNPFIHVKRLCKKFGISNYKRVTEMLTKQGSSDTLFDIYQAICFCAKNTPDKRFKIETNFINSNQIK